MHDAVESAPDNTVVTSALHITRTAHHYLGSNEGVLRQSSSSLTDRIISDGPSNKQIAALQDIEMDGLLKPIPFLQDAEATQNIVQTIPRLITLITTVISE